MQDLILKHIRHKSIKGKKEGPHLLILSGVHGNEYEPMAAAMQLLEEVPRFLERGMVTIVPIVNFPAFKKASRVGEDGLDLARICPGSKSGSESEVIAAEVSELISVSDFVIDLHTGGDLHNIAPFCGYVLHSSQDVLEKQRYMARAFNLPTLWGTSAHLDGRTLSVARDHNIPAVYAEFGGGGGFNKIAVKDYVQGCKNIIMALNMSEGVCSVSNSKYEVEDYRRESGHLQVMLPASAEGFFKAEVSVGDFVKKGQLIGSLKGALGETISTVNADQDGMVFMLRGIASVKKGDSLGGVLPISQPGKVLIQ